MNRFTKLRRNFFYTTKEYLALRFQRDVAVDIGNEALDDLRKEKATTERLQDHVNSLRRTIASAANDCTGQIENYDGHPDAHLYCPVLHKIHRRLMDAYYGTATK